MARRAAQFARAMVVTVAVVLPLAACDRPPGRPISCPILGIDVSHHQGLIDWPRVARAGVRFAWIKATEGGDYLDPLFARNWRRAAEAGVRRGAYHFVYWCRAAEDQARWFVTNLPDDRDALPPVIDLEWTPGSRTCPNKVAREQALAALKLMAEAVERRDGRRPLIYAPADIYDEVLAGAADGERLWVRSLGATLPANYGTQPWSVWQFAEDGHVPGIDTPVDLDCLQRPDALVPASRAEAVAGSTHR